MKIDFFYQHLQLPWGVRCTSEAFIKGMSNSNISRLRKCTLQVAISTLVNGSRKNITIQKLQFLKTDNKQLLLIRFMIEILVGFMFALKIVTSRKPRCFFCRYQAILCFICIALWIRRIPYVGDFMTYILKFYSTKI